MNHMEKRWLDRFAFALGSVTIASPYSVIPIVPNDRINAAWAERLGAETGPGQDPARSRIGWAT